MNLRLFRAFSRRTPGFGRKRPSPVGDVDEARTRIKKALEEQNVAFADVVRTRYWLADPPLAGRTPMA
jgi:hypothetical protein